jgi:Rhodopirellula transposase DDE domain
LWLSGLVGDFAGRICYVAVSEAEEAALAAKFAVMRRFLDERGWRVYLGTEARALGYGGIAAVARAAGVSQTTVAAGAAEAADAGALGALGPGRSRRPGAGRPRAEDVQPGLAEALESLLEEGRRGDPMSALTWSTLSLRDIAGQLAVLGFGCSKDTVARLMRADGYSLQGMSRVLEGSQHEDRDAQFGHINAKIGEYQAAGEPVISVDGKKKERLGAYHRNGRSWRPGGDPVRVGSHDFPAKDTVTITPYGVYDITANRGFVPVGTSCDTAAFAVNAICLWWQAEGSLRYPHATRLLVTCDAGGSNDHRCRLWKDQLAVLAAQTGLRIEVCHFPPGTSKWNKIEHRLFCHITRTWRARPLMSIDDAVAGIAATVTAQGLKCSAVLDERDYPDGVKISDARMTYLKDRVLEQDAFHGEWNYAVPPAPRAAPEPEPEPARPGRVPCQILNHPALTGLRAEDLTALAQALEVPFEARLAQRNYTQRGGPRVNAVRTTRTHGNRRLSITDHLLALRLRDHLGLPLQVIAALLGVDPATISHAAAQAAGLLAAARITPQASPPPARPPRTPAALLAYATQAGIPLTIPENGQAIPDRFRTRRNRPPETRPKQPTK